MTKFVVVDPRPGDADIHAALDQRVPLARIVHRHKGQFDLGIRCAEGMDDVGQHAVGRGTDEADRQASDRARPGLPDGVFGGIHPVQNVPRPLPQDFAGGGEPDLTARAVEEAGAEFLFQRLYLAGQRRLRNAEPCRRPAEMKLIGDGDEIMEAAEVHGYLPENLWVAAGPTHRFIAQPIPIRSRYDTESVIVLDSSHGNNALEEFGVGVQDSPFRRSTFPQVPARKRVAVRSRRDRSTTGAGKAVWGRRPWQTAK